MPETPADRPVERRIDLTAADVATLVDMGAIEAEPPPETQPIGPG